MWGQKENNKKKKNSVDKSRPREYFGGEGGGDTDQDSKVYG